MALGYSSAGTIVALGKGMQGFKVGQRVACAGGGFAVHAEYNVVPRNLLTPLPKNVDFESAAFTTLGAIALHGFRLAEPQIGENVAVVGLGLLGLSTYTAQQRAKEIGIRKVMGAELGNIFVLLNKQFIWLSLIAFAIAAPVSWYIMVNTWLVDFKFKITVGWELFAISMLCGLVVSLLTVSYHAIKAALINPAETLKYE